MVDLVTGVSIGLILLIPVIIGWAYGKRLEEKRRQKEEEQKQKEEERKKKNSWDYKVQGLPKEEDNDKP